VAQVYIVPRPFLVRRAFLVSVQKSCDLVCLHWRQKRSHRYFVDWRGCEPRWGSEAFAYAAIIGEPPIPGVA